MQPREAWEKTCLSSLLALVLLTLAFPLCTVYGGSSGTATVQSTSDIDLFSGEGTSQLTTGWWYNVSSIQNVTGTEWRKDASFETGDWGISSGGGGIKHSSRQQNIVHDGSWSGNISIQVSDQSGWVSTESNVRPWSKPSYLPGPESGDLVFYWYVNELTTEYGYAYASMQIEKFFEPTEIGRSWLITPSVNLKVVFAKGSQVSFSNTTTDYYINATSDYNVTGQWNKCSLNVWQIAHDIKGDYPVWFNYVTPAVRVQEVSTGDVELLVDDFSIKTGARCGLGGQVTSQFNVTDGDENATWIFTVPGNTSEAWGQHFAFTYPKGHTVINVTAPNGTAVFPSNQLSYNTTHMELSMEIDKSAGGFGCGGWKLYTHAPNIMHQVVHKQDRVEDPEEIHPNNLEVCLRVRNGSDGNYLSGALANITVYEATNSTVEYSAGGSTDADGWWNQTISQLDSALYFLRANSTYGSINYAGIKIRELNVTESPAPTIGKFQAPSTVYAHRYVYLNWTVMDPDGNSDIKNSTLELSNNVVIGYDNSSDIFTEVEDPNNQALLDADASFKTEVNSTALKLSAHVKFAWNYTEGIIDLVSADVYDGGGNLGNASLTGWFTFEDDLIVYTGDVDDGRVNPGDTVTFTGTLYMEGTADPPGDINGITVKVELDGILKGSTKSIQADGSFSIPVTGESEFGQHFYVVYAATDENTVQNQTVSVSVDGLKVDDCLVDMADEKVYAHMKYALDNSSIPGGTVNLAGETAATNSTGWAVFDISGFPDFAWNQTCYGVDAAHGITYKAENQTLLIAKKHHLIQSSLEISSASWDGSELTIQFTGEAGSYRLNVSGSRPVYVKGVTYELSTDYSTYLTLSHTGSRTISVGWPSWGDLYVNGLTSGWIYSIYWSDQTLNMVMNGTAGSQGSLTVHCGSRGMPPASSGFLGLVYNSGTTLLSGSYEFGSQITLSLQFAVSTTDGGADIPITFSLDAQTFTVKPGSEGNIPLNFTWMGTNQITITKVGLGEDFAGWVTVAEPLPKIVFKSVGENLGRGNVKVCMTIPADVEPGNYSVLVAASAETVGGRLEASGWLTINVQQPPQPLAPHPPQDYAFLGMVAASTGAMAAILILYLKTR